jgi:pseudouridine kinase
MKGKIICIGAALVDEVFICQTAALAGTSNPAVSQKTIGGVMCNVARHLGLMKLPVEIVTVLGRDEEGSRIMNELKACNVGTSYLQFSDEPTGKYAAIMNPDGSLFSAACSDVSGRYLAPDLFGRLSSELTGAALVIADTNISEGALEWLSFFCRNHHIPFIIEPVSVEKAKKLAKIDLSGVFMVTPNEDELPSLCNLPVSADNQACADDLMKRGVKQVWLRMGSSGSAIISKKGSTLLVGIPIKVLDSTGAGDAALAGWVAAWYSDLDELSCLQVGQSLACEVLQTRGAILSAVDMVQLFSKYYPDEK